VLLRGRSLALAAIVGALLKATYIAYSASEALRTIGPEDFKARQIECRAFGDTMACTYEVIGPEGKTYTLPAIFLSELGEGRYADGSKAAVTAVIARDFPEARTRAAAYWPWRYIWTKVVIWALLGAFLCAFAGLLGGIVVALRRLVEPMEAR
jgi:hypothetical protein